MKEKIKQIKSKTSKVLTEVDKKVSAIKNYLVKDNVGLHFCVAYIVYDVSVKWHNLIGLTGVLLGIILMEIHDRYIQKGIFSTKDIIAGLLGLAIAYYMNT